MQPGGKYVAKDLYDVGGVPEVVLDGVTGLLANRYKIIKKI